MVAGIIVRGMLKVHDRRPACRRMAGIAILAGNEVIGSLTGRRRAIMTGHAIAGNTLMIPGAAHESRRGMTIVAIKGRR